MAAINTKQKMEMKENDHQINDDSDKNEYYKLTEIHPFGANVTNIDLSKVKITEKLIENIRNDIHKYQLLVFKQQASENDYVVPPLRRVQFICSDI